MRPKEDAMGDAGDTYGPWNVSWKTHSPADGERGHNRGFPFHTDAQDFADTLESDPEVYDLTIWDS
jgi:hypothetical protein